MHVEAEIADERFGNDLALEALGLERARERAQALGDYQTLDFLGEQFLARGGIVGAFVGIGPVGLLGELGGGGEQLGGGVGHDPLLLVRQSVRNRNRVPIGGWSDRP